MTDDPDVIRSLAVSPADIVDAFVYSQENPGEAVLRVTPPFHGRMRARLHVYHVDDTELTGAVHVRPANVIADDVVADYPQLEETLTDVDDAEADRLRQRHADAVDAWQQRAREAIADSVTIDIGCETTQVDLKRLG